MKEEDIIRLVTGQIDTKEKEKFLEQVSGSPETKEEYYKIKNLWALTLQAESKRKANISDLQKFKKTIQRKKLISFRKKTFPILKYAAVFLLTLIAGKFIFKENEVAKTEDILEFNEISVPPGQMAEVTLSDGTNIFINSCSSLKYPARFKSDERKVYLSGEAFFSVTKNSTPFIVETNSQKNIKVLGTKFNLMAYPNDILYQATLIEGKIAIVDSEDNELSQLSPGEQYSYDMVRNKYTVKTVNTNLYDSWKNGIYTFDHETLEDLSSRLERIFNLKININNNTIRNYKFTGTISRNVPFEQILKIIQISAPIKYKFKETNGAIEEVTLY